MKKIFLVAALRLQTIFVFVIRFWIQVSGADIFGRKGWMHANHFHAFGSVSCHLSWGAADVMFRESVARSKLSFLPSKPPPLSLSSLHKMEMNAASGLRCLGLGLVCTAVAIMVLSTASSKPSETALSATSAGLHRPVGVSARAAPSLRVCSSTVFAVPEEACICLPCASCANAPPGRAEREERKGSRGFPSSSVIKAPMFGVGGSCSRVGCRHVPCPPPPF